MTTTLWLRISAGIAFFFAAGHTLGGRKLWSPMGDNAVLQAMRTTTFDVMGAPRTYLDFYLGFGHSISVTMFMQAVLLWQLATLAQTDALRVRPLIVVFTIAVAACGVIAWRFLIPVPALFSLVLVASLAVAYAVAR